MRGERKKEKNTYKHVDIHESCAKKIYRPQQMANQKTEDSGKSGDKDYKEKETDA